MATASLTSTPTTLTVDTAAAVWVKNTGATRVTVVNGADIALIRPGRDANFPRSTGTVTAYVTSRDGGSGTITYEASGARIDPVTYDEVSEVVAGLTGTYAPFRSGQTIVGIGDSMLAAAGPGTGMYEVAVLRSGGKLWNLYNAGVSGNTSAQMLARFATDVVAKAPDVALILSGTNDLLQGVAVATHVANVEAMVLAAKAASITPVVVSIPPNGTSPHSVAARNIALASMCRLRGVQFIDIYTALVDPATGGYASAYNADGTHPNMPGMLVAGDIIASALAPRLFGMPTLPGENAEAVNLLGNGLFLANASGLGTGWSVISSPAGASHSIDSSDATIKGNWQVITLASTNGYHSINREASSGFSVGDRLLMCGRYNASAITAPANWSVRVMRNGSFHDQIVQNQTEAMAGIFQYVWTVPAGTTSVGLVLFGTGTGGSITAKFAQLGVYNLTVNGSGV